MSQLIEDLKAGRTVQFRPRGNSMLPRIHSGDLVTVSPDVSSLSVGDVVYCKVKGRVYVHLISAIRGDQYQISNNHGHINGWTKQIYGKVVNVQP